MNKSHLSLLLATAAFAAGCGKKPHLKGIKAAKVAVETTVSTVTSGTVTAEQQAVLGFSAAGRVARIQGKLGDRVRKGQILAELDNADLRAASVDADAELQRNQELFKEGLVSKAAFDDVKRAFETARTAYERSIIRAPFDGTLTELNLQLGELAATAPAKAPMRVVDEQPRIVKGEIDEVDLSKVKEGAPARIKILAVKSQPLPAEVTKVVSFIGTTREQDRSAQVELKFKEANTSVPVGASADIEIVVAAKDGVLGIPSRAILGSGANRHVFKFEDGKVHRVDIKIGAGNYDRSEILEGINEGDIVVQPNDDVELKEGLKAQVDVQPWP